jgi:hypothetical protein
MWVWRLLTSCVAMRRFSAGDNGDDDYIPHHLDESALPPRAGSARCGPSLLSPPRLTAPGIDRLVHAPLHPLDRFLRTDKTIGPNVERAARGDAQGRTSKSWGIGVRADLPPDSWSTHHETPRRGGPHPLPGPPAEVVRGVHWAVSATGGLVRRPLAEGAVRVLGDVFRPPRLDGFHSLAVGPRSPYDVRHMTVLG